MAIILDDDNDPILQELLNTQKAFEVTLNFFKATDIHMPAATADAVVALKVFHSKQLETAQSAVQNYIKGKKNVESSQAVKSAVNS